MFPSSHIPLKQIILTCFLKISNLLWYTKENDENVDISFSIKNENIRNTINCGKYFLLQDLNLPDCGYYVYQHQS